MNKVDDSCKFVFCWQARNFRDGTICRCGFLKAVKSNSVVNVKFGCMLLNSCNICQSWKCLYHATNIRDTSHN
jgi:hypothetical protein